jgi:hypothetical protein
VAQVAQVIGLTVAAAAEALAALTEMAALAAQAEEVFRVYLQLKVHLAKQVQAAVAVVQVLLAHHLLQVAVVVLGSVTLLHHPVPKVHLQAQQEHQAEAAQEWEVHQLQTEELTAVAEARLAEATVAHKVAKAAPALLIYNGLYQNLQHQIQIQN